MSGKPNKYGKVLYIASAFSLASIILIIFTLHYSTAEEKQISFLNKLLGAQRQSTPGLPCMNMHEALITLVLIVLMAAISILVRRKISTDKNNEMYGN